VGCGYELLSGGGGSEPFELVISQMLKPRFGIGGLQVLPELIPQEPQDVIWRRLVDGNNRGRRRIRHNRGANPLGRHCPATRE
jgi:hypothetical protein